MLWAPISGLNILLAGFIQYYVCFTRRAQVLESLDDEEKKERKKDAKKRARQKRAKKAKEEAEATSGGASSGQLDVSDV
jgi:hypothetical protein